MSRKTPSTHDRRSGYMMILFRRTANRLGFNLDTLPEPVLHFLWEDFLMDINHGVRRRDIWPRFDARLDALLGPTTVKSLLRRKRNG